MRLLNKNLLSVSLAAGLATLAGAPLHAQPDTGASGGGQPAADRTLEEIVVTARRREESAQETPVALAVLDTDALYRNNITEIRDLTASVPGVNFTQSGGANNTVFSIRGRSRAVFGNSQPAVASYVNEVPLSTWGASIPTYDMASVQVLKGPQGTLFGRNTTAGAVLTTTQRPEHEFGGYLMGKIGNYNARVVEGAVNIPVVADKVALRIAGQLDKRDGFTDNMSRPSEDDFDNKDRTNYRVSLLLDPIESLSNLTVYEENDYDENMINTIPMGYEPGTGAVDFIPFTNGSFLFTNPTVMPFIPCNGAPTCDIQALMARQKAAGVRKEWTDSPTFLKTELTSVSNTTTWDVGPFTLKNIFGYREVFTNNFSDIDGSDMAIVNADNLIDVKQYSNEFQISGEALDGDLEYIGGYFWLKSEPNGAQRLALQILAQAGTPLDSQNLTDLGGLFPFLGALGPSDHYTDETEAFFGQVSYDLGGISDSLAALSVDIGVRHTKDETEVCPVPATFYGTPAPKESACDPADKAAADFSKTTWSLGLNYQPVDDLLVYAVTRTGYRAGGVNSPKFGGSLVPFQSYEPETVQDYEIGLKSDWAVGDILGRFNLALYRSEYEDVHFSVPTTGVNTGLGGVDGDGNPLNDPTGGLFTNNAGEATVEGIEVELVAQLLPGLEVSLAGTKMEKDFKTSFALPVGFPPNVAADDEIEAFLFLGAPDWSYTAAIDYSLPLAAELGEVVLSTRYFRISDIHYGGNIYAWDYEKVDARVDWLGMFGSSFDAALFVTNAFDTEAIVAPSSSSAALGVNAAIFNEPRMVGASLRYSF
ncbi:MAG: TonB-dependent receptor [Pseudomonadota bacterium]|nr:TonB-dependent receptor [Pseudomonadota bacterium]